MSNLVTVDSKWTLSSFFGTGDGKSGLSIDLFKLINDKALTIGASLGVLGYFFYADGSIEYAIKHSFVPMIGIGISDYIGLGHIPNSIIGVVGGSFILNKYLLKDYYSIENTDMMYASGGAILGGYLFKTLYNTFFYKAEESTA